MKRILEFELGPPGSILVDMDNDPDARFEVSIHTEDADDGDGIVLVANRPACLAFARLFAQLAEQGGHVHLGYSDEEPQGPGVRIVVDDTGRQSPSRVKSL